MTLEEAIRSNEDLELSYRDRTHRLPSEEAKKVCLQIATNYHQQAEWLRELQERRKQPEIITCGECVNFVERDFCKVAGHNVHRKSNCMKVFGAERRTDDKTNKGSSC